jgi:anaerobic magnesium-protoporphyrin IX monomethyl ester cyclase
MMNKIMMIMPPDIYAKDGMQTGSAFPRIGVAYVAGYLRSKGLTVSILDSEVLHLTIDDVAVKIREFAPDAIGLGPFTEEILSAYEVCKIAKQINPHMLTVMGGPHASAIPERTLRECPSIDVVICGEGEIAFWEVLQSSSLESVKGLVYRSGDSIITTDSRTHVKNIDSLPYPAWDLFPIEAYRGILIRNFSEQSGLPTLQLPIISSRGCPYQCIFCYKTLPGFRAREASNVIDELEFNLKTYGATDFFFVDGTFGVDRKKGEAICDEIIKRGLNTKITFEVETRVNIVNDRFMAKLKKAGCVQVYFGVESGDQEMLKVIKKDITLEMAEKAVAMAKKHGLITTCTFVICLPGETKKAIKKTYRFARKLDPDFIAVGIMIPYPGTYVRELAETGRGNYRLISDDWRDYMKQKGGPLELMDINIHQLRKIHEWEYLKYFMRPRKLLFLLKNVPKKKLLAAGLDVVRTILTPSKHISGKSS